MKKIIAFVLLAFFITSCGSNEGGDKQAQLDKLLKQQAKLSEQIRTLKEEIKTKSGDNTGIRLVEITKPTPELFRHFVEVQAKVDGDESVMVTPRSQGTVTAILVKEGDKVSKGQVLATLDDQLIKQMYAEVQTQYDFAKNIYEKQKNLWDQKIGSEVQFLTAKNNKESLEKRIGSVNEQLDLTKVKSPVNGTVDNVAIKIGQAIMPGTPAISVVNLTNLKVKGEVGESYAGKINKGDQVVLFFPDINKEITSTVTFASKSINTLNRTFNVEVALDKTADDLKPNMVAVMKIVDYINEKAIVLPIDLLQRSADGYYTMIAVTEGNKLIAKRRAVETGQMYNGKAEVLSGISADDNVVIIGYRDLNEGEEIRTK